MESNIYSSGHNYRLELHSRKSKQMEFPDNSCDSVMIKENHCLTNSTLHYKIEDKKVVSVFQQCCLRLNF